MLGSTVLCNDQTYSSLSSKALKTAAFRQQIISNAFGMLCSKKPLTLVRGYTRAYHFAVGIYIGIITISFMRVFFSHKCLEYSQEGHSESPKRIKLVLKELKGEFTEAKPCSDKDLQLCHAKEMINKIRQRAFADADTPALPRIFDFSKLAAGAAIQAALHTAETGETTFSLMRPPGHHAGRNFFGGFCYFNSIAIAVETAIKELDRIAIVDIDGHHGNGTQDIFLGRKDILYVSLHQKNAFPLSGFVSQQNCLNYPITTGTPPKAYMKTFCDALENIERFSPDIIAVSAGFDAYRKDPLLQLDLDIKTYFEIGDAIRLLNKPVFAVMEGGYSQDVGLCAKQFLKGLGNTQNDSRPKQHSGSGG